MTGSGRFRAGGREGRQRLGHGGRAIELCHRGGLEAGIALGHEGFAAGGFAQAALDPLADELGLGGWDGGFFGRHALGIVLGSDGFVEQALAGATGDDGLVSAAAFEDGGEIGEIEVGLLLVIAMAFEAVLAEDGLDVLVVGDDGIGGVRGCEQNWDEQKGAHVFGKGMKEQRNGFRGGPELGFGRGIGEGLSPEGKVDSGEGVSLGPCGAVCGGVTGERCWKERRVKGALGLLSGRVPHTQGRLAQARLTLG